MVEQQTGYPALPWAPCECLGMVLAAAGMEETAMEGGAGGQRMRRSHGRLTSSLPPI